MKQKIKILAIVLVVSMILPTASQAIGTQESADNKQDYSMVYLISKSQEEIDKEFDDALKQIEDSVIQRGPKYDYKTEYLPQQRKTVGGYAGNQLSGGYKFPTGGGFWWTDSGGPSVSFSINVSLPRPYNVMSFSINMGTYGSSGLYVSAPNNTDYFKLYVQKTILLKPYVTYEKPKDSNTWSVFSSGAAQVVESASAYAVKV